MWIGRKGGREKVDVLGSEFWSSYGVLIPKLLNCEIVWKILCAEIPSASMRGDLLVYNGMGVGVRSKIDMLRE